MSRTVRNMTPWRNPPPPSHFCVLCGGRRSSEWLRLGPVSIVDGIICSRPACSAVKTRIAPSLQINNYFYGCCGPGCHSIRSAGCDEPLPAAPLPDMAGRAAATQVSPLHTAELPGSVVRRGSAQSDSPPPAVNRNTKPRLPWRSGMA